MKSYILILALLFSAVDVDNDLIVHYKLNDYASSSTIIDDTGVHNGTYKDGGGAINAGTGAVLTTAEAAIILSYDANTNDVIDGAEDYAALLAFAAGSLSLKLYTIIVDMESDGRSIAAIPTGTRVGSIGTSLDFDGDEYIEIADHADFTPTLTPYSISAWVYMEDANDFQIASKGVYDTDGEWQFHTNDSNAFSLIFYDEDVDTCYIRRRDASAATADVWTHVVGTYNGGTSYTGMAIWENAANVGDAGNNLDAFVEVSAQGHNVWIGRYNDTYATGRIDNVMIFRKALNCWDIDILYNAGSGTEISAELDERISPRRSNLSNMPTRRRYEF